MKFRDRIDAGRLLANELKKYANDKNAILLALPRGGVVVGYEISKILNLPLEALLVRKLGTPGQEELAMGAIAMGNVRVLNEDVIKGLGIPRDVIDEVTEQEKRELERRNQVYRHGQPLPHLENRTVILVDDGLATGATMQAAVLAVKKLNPAYIIIAVPISAKNTYLKFKSQVDEIICLDQPEMFFGIGQWYDHFPQNTDEEVMQLLESAAQKEQKKT